MDPLRPRGGAIDATVADLPRLLRSGDLVVLNDAATIPASLWVRRRSGSRVELRLTGRSELGWGAIALGTGDWHLDTEARPPVTDLAVGELLELADGSHAHVVSASGREVSVAFAHPEDAWWAFMYRHAAPIQYRYASRALAAADVQTPWASRPFAVEMPSAARPVTIALVLALRRAGVEVAALTHAAGISSTGDPTVDRRLPFPERYVVPPHTADAVTRTRAKGGRILAIGTSVVRALEGAHRNGGVLAGQGETSLVIRPGFRPAVVDGLLSGVHEPGTSHFEVLQAFAGPGQLRHAALHAAAGGYGIHEFGDSTLVLAGAAERLGGHRQPRYCAA